MLAAFFTNPLDSQDFWPTVIRVVGLLAVGALLVLVVERKPWSELRETTLFKRVMSWAVMAPVFMLSVFVGGLVALVIVTFIVVQSSAEYARLVGLQRRYGWVLVILGVGTLVSTGLMPEYFLYSPLVALAAITLVPVVTGEVDSAHYQVTSTFFGYIYTCFTLSYMVFIRAVEPDGVPILLLIGMSVALSDVMAFTVGSVVGGPKLAPRVSPNKTWSGAGGNVIGAYLGLAVMWFAVPDYWTTTTIVLAPLFLAAASLWGDLIESFVKRDYGVKDAGDMLPGFGGLLDRVDSLIVALPVTYYAIMICQHFTF